MQPFGESVVVVPPYQGASIEVRCGEAVRIVDVAGMQIGDVIIVSLEHPREAFSQAATRLIENRMRISEGATLYSNRGRPMVRIEYDPVGAHDIVGYPCDQGRYEQDFFTPDHPSCRSNLHKLLSPYGYSIDDVHDPFNIFMDTRIYEGRRTVTEVPMSRAGDSAILRALVDVLVAVSACPQDLYPANGYDITELRLERISA